MSEVLVGICFALPTVFYIITGPFLLPIITKGFEQRTTIMIGFFILTWAGFLVGPSQILGFPSKSIIMMLIGLWVLGIGAAFTIIPIIPEMIDTVKDKYEGRNSELSDYFSAIFNMSGAIGLILGPTLAGLLNDEIGFRFSLDSISCTILLFNILYILICGGIGSIMRSFRAKMISWKRKTSPTLVSDSPKHHLLNEDPDSQQSSDIEEWTNYNQQSILI